MNKVLAFMYAAIIEFTFMILCSAIGFAGGVCFGSFLVNSDIGFFDKLAGVLVMPYYLAGLGCFIGVVVGEFLLSRMQERYNQGKQVQ